MTKTYKKFDQFWWREVRTEHQFINHRVSQWKHDTLRFYVNWPEFDTQEEVEHHARIEWRKMMQKDMGYNVRWYCNLTKRRNRRKVKQMLRKGDYENIPMKDLKNKWYYLW